MKKASTILLAIEAVVIAFLAIEGAMITLGVVTSFAIGQGRFSFTESIAATVMFCALISGCRIFGWVITNGPSKGIYIYPVWWVFAGLGAALAILSQFNCFFELLGLSLERPGILSLAQPGALFLIPFVHLIIETIWQRRTCQVL